jgi:RNA polymerase sigma factor (sigma-70 family)
MLHRQDPETLLRENLPRIDAIAGALCRRHGLVGDAADDFASWVRFKLVEDDYAVLRKFRGESSLPTYLTVVLAMLFREHRVRERGRWRPSAAARREGPVAVRLETLIYRDGHSLGQAAEILRTSGETDLPDRDIRALLARLPPRRELRPVPVGADPLESTAAPERADAGVLARETDAERRSAEAALFQALDELPAEDRVIVRMRIWEDLSVADVARGLGIPQKPLYRRLERIFGRLRAHLEGAGVTPELVRRLVQEGAS